MKVAIIGAGICGLYLGWKLAERGEEVTVFEKREKIGKEACSGLFSERILEFIPESQKLIQNRINYTLIHLPSRTLKIRFARKFFVMDHFKLDNLVAELAQKAGAKIILNNPINSLPALQNFPKENLGRPGGFEKVIGCDGANSVVRRYLGGSQLNYRLAIQGFLLKENFSKASTEPCGEPFGRMSYVETWPIKQGFIWKIPIGKETEYGIIGKTKGVNLLFDQFLKKNNLSLAGIKSALVPQGFNIPRNEAITLCGDAAGLTKPWSGGGVIWGLLAADLLLKNFPDFLKYQKEAKKFFFSKIIFSKIITKMFYFFGFNIPWLIPQNVNIESDFLIQ